MGGVEGGVFLAPVSLHGVFVLASCFLVCYRARLKVYSLRHGVEILALTFLGGDLLINWVGLVGAGTHALPLVSR